MMYVQVCEWQLKISINFRLNIRLKRLWPDKLNHNNANVGNQL